MDEKIKLFDNIIQLKLNKNLNEILSSLINTTKVFFMKYLLVIKRITII